MVAIPLAIAVVLANTVAEVMAVVIMMDAVILLVMARPAVLVQVVSDLALSLAIFLLLLQVTSYSIQAHAQSLESS